MKTPRLILFLIFTVTAFAMNPVGKPAAKPELPKTGVNLARSSGGWLNVRVEDHRFFVNFYDTDKKPVAPNTSGGLIRFVYVVKAPSHQWRVALNPSDGKLGLVSPQRVKPPHVFRVYMTLYREGSEEELENYAFQYP